MIIKNMQQVFVRALTGKTFAININQNVTIETVKNKVKDKEGLP
jgi:hypothetical protein